MKRLLAFLLSFVFVLSFCACKEKEEKQSGKVDIEYYANLGQIPEGEFVLGDSGDTIKNTLENRQKEDDHSDAFLDIYEGENNVMISDGTYQYYYKKATSEKGIGYIVSYSDAYGFKLGDAVLSVKESLKNYEIKEETVTEENLFFYMGDFANSSMITVKFEKSTVIFVFENNALCATVLYSNENWK